MDTNRHEFKEHPILFSGPMVRAILDGRKTQTRRPINPQPTGVDPQFDGHPAGGGWVWTGRSEKNYQFCLYGVPGDRLWVRETFRDARKFAAGRVLYRANEVDGDNACGWMPSIFMPRSLSRITLEVTKIRVERIKEISAADASAEGVTYPVNPSDKYPGKCSVLWDIGSEFSPLSYIAKRDYGNHEAIMRAHFAATWDKLNFKRGFGWKKNPWVWVVEFKKL